MSVFLEMVEIRNAILVTSFCPAASEKFVAARNL